MSSNDYYSSTNYATRLVGDNLVIYTPFDVYDMTQPTFRWPVVRRWRRTTSARSTSTAAAGPCSTPPTSTGRSATDRRSDRPHRLRLPARPGRRGGATSNAAAPPSSARARSQWYVTETRRLSVDGRRATYASYESPGLRRRAATFDGAATQPALLYRVPVDGAAPRPDRRRAACRPTSSRCTPRRPLPGPAQGPPRNCRDGPDARRGSPISTCRCAASARPSREAARDALHAAARRQVAP